MSEVQYKEFVTKLEKLYGKFEQEHKRFENANNSHISRELGYSDAQFSRLINESATEGEYQRAIQNVDRILTVNKLEARLSNLPTANGHSRVWKYIAITLPTLLLVLFALHWYQDAKDTVNIRKELPRDYTLRWTFESAFINPYVKLEDLPSDCNYPCYKYQGKWTLKDSYKLPFFRERNGFHYLATHVDMYARCMTEESDQGNLLEAFEYQRHEIWYDQREWPIDSFIQSGHTPSNYYQEMDFAANSNFVRMATIHTFFRNEFAFNDSTIQRSGKVIGRDLEMVEREVVAEQVSSEVDLNAISLEITRIIGSRLEDFSVPIQCKDAPLINSDVTQIRDGDEMGFACQLTTNGFSVDYTKTYVFTDQYIKNNCVGGK